MAVWVTSNRGPCNCNMGTYGYRETPGLEKLMFNWFKKNTLKQDTTTALGIIKKWDAQIKKLMQQNEQMSQEIAAIVTMAESRQDEMQRRLDKLKAHEVPCHTLLTYLVAQRKILDACLGKQPTDLEQWPADNIERFNSLPEAADNTAESQARRDLPPKAESHLFGKDIPTGPMNPK